MKGVGRFSLAGGSGMIAKRSLRSGIVAAAACALAALPSTESLAQARVGDVAEPFELVELRSGEPLDLAGLRGSIVLLDFFSYW